MRKNEPVKRWRKKEKRKAQNQATSPHLEGHFGGIIQTINQT
jgi:hypothetical protein